jgi:SRSO17 transposase
MAVADEAVDWASGLDALVEQIAPRFRRIEARRRVRAYLRGLLAPVERKNGWQLAEHAGDRTPDAVQDFLARMRWDADQVRDDLRCYVIAQWGEADGVLVLDETGFIKKAASRSGCSGSIRAPPGGLRIARSGCFSAMPAGTVTR